MLLLHFERGEGGLVELSRLGGVYMILLSHN